MAIETQPVTLLTSDGLHLVGDVVAAAGTTGASADERSIAGAVVCHPHPLYGGDRFNGVVDAVVRTLAAAGVVALRFDFRGVNASEGAHSGGDGERLDVVAAVDTLAGRADLAGRPLWLVGYSFGATTVLGVDDPRIAGWVAIAPPIAMAPTRPAAALDPRAKHVVVAGHDQFSSPDATLPLIESWTHTAVTVLPSADHFLQGHLTEVTRLTLAAIDPRET